MDLVVGCWRSSGSIHAQGSLRMHCTGGQRKAHLMAVTDLGNRCVLGPRPECQLGGRPALLGTGTHSHGRAQAGRRKKRSFVAILIASTRD